LGFISSPFWVSDSISKGQSAKGGDYFLSGCEMTAWVAGAVTVILVLSNIIFR
jgi:hypothetical protein